jgi:hypothetical protein
MILNKETKEKLNEYLIKKLGMYDYRRGWLKGDCPGCGKHKFGVNLSQNKSNCFSCDYKLKPLDIVKDIENTNSMGEVFNILNHLEGISYIEEEVEAYQLKTETVLPEGYRNIKRGDSVLAKSARAFVKRRGFNINKMSRKGWGYGTKDKYFGYIIMPFYVDNKLVYFNARLFLGSGPKFNNPDITEFGLGKSFIIYNKDALYLYKTIWIVESVTNSETIGDNACAMGGKSLSAVQINEIIKSPCEKIIIGLDLDAIDKAIALAFKLVEYKKVKVIVMDSSKDIKKALKKAYQSRYLTSYKEVMKLKNELIK